MSLTKADTYVYYKTLHPSPPSIKLLRTQIKQYFSKNHIERVFIGPKKTHTSLSLYKEIGKPPSLYIIRDVYEDTRHINEITDFFSERVRVKCQFRKHDSPADFWKKNGKRIREKYRGDLHMQREAMYSETKLCNNFRITVALAVLNHFQPRRWLDISAGWGDRLLAAIFSSPVLQKELLRYESCDPNLSLHPCYREMIDTLVAPTRRHRFTVHPCGFLEAPIYGSTFDLVFSSPPFFDLEKYSSETQDSITTFPSESLWIRGFLEPAIKKAVAHLSAGGHIVLYMGGSPAVMHAMHNALSLREGMDYRGVIYFCDTSFRAMYVWKKIK